MRTNSDLYSLIKLMMKTLIITAIIYLFLFRVAVVYGDSMVPTLYNGDRVIVWLLNFDKDFKRGEIVCLKSPLSPNKIYIKRVIGIPGDHVEIKEGRVFINEERLEENYIWSSYTKTEVDIVLRENEYFVLGDNRENSADSRDPRIGPIKKEDIIGKSVYRIYPLNRIGRLGRLGDS